MSGNLKYLLFKLKTQRKKSYDSDRLTDVIKCVFNVKKSQAVNSIFVLAIWFINKANCKTNCKIFSQFSR